MSSRHRSLPMRSFLFVLLAGLPACHAPAARSAPAVTEGRPSGLLEVDLGARSLDDDEAWDQIEHPAVLAFGGTWLGDPLGLELGVSLAADSTTVGGVDVTDTFVELSAGPRFTFGEGPLMPYLGVGVALVAVEVEGEQGGLSVSDDDTTAGFYAHGGLIFRIGSVFHIGLDARLLRGSSVQVFGVDTDADYGQITLVLAWGV